MLLLVKHCMILLLILCFHSYRTRDEIKEVRSKRDPITGFKEKILEANLVTNPELKVGNDTCRQQFAKSFAGVF